MSAARARRGVALALLVVLAAAGGYAAGLKGWRPGAWRAIPLDESAIGVAPPIALALPVLADAPVENLVLLVGDGMGATQIEAARWSALGAEGRFVFERFPVIGLVSTAAVGAPVVDSAAAATALATGVATRNRAVGVGPDGRRLWTLVEAAHAAGLGTGLVTTSEIHDATPAAFAAHARNRDDRLPIALQLATSGVDLLIGGGREAFAPRRRGGVRSDGSDLLAEARARGVTVAASEAELAGANALPLWALFPGRPDKAERPPALGDWCDKALALLAARRAAKGGGFVLLVEEEGIDSAGHARDLAALARAMARFDRAVAAAARFAAADGKTLVVVVGDHATGGLTIDHSTSADRLRVAWASGKHTGEPVPLFAYGPAGAAARFGGAYTQAEAGRRLAGALGLDVGDRGESP